MAARANEAVRLVEEGLMNARAPQLDKVNVRLSCLRCMLSVHEQKRQGLKSMKYEISGVAPTVHHSQPVIS